MVEPGISEVNQRVLKVVTSLVVIEKREKLNIWFSKEVHINGIIESVRQFKNLRSKGKQRVNSPAPSRTALRHVNQSLQP